MMRFNNLVVIGTLFMTCGLLAGCNNDSNNNAGQQPAASGDEFIAVVKTQTDGANAMSDEAEPIDIMQVNATSPEDTEPQVVMF
jgi:hypothetical protein